MYVNLCCTAECLGYIYTHIYTDILFHILFHYGVSQEVEYSSPSGTAGPCFSLLYTVYPFASANPKRPLRPSAALHPPWQPQVSSLVCEPVSDSEIGSTWKRGRAASAFLCLASLARCGHLWVPPAPAPLRSAPPLWSLWCGASHGRGRRDPSLPPCARSGVAPPAALTLTRIPAAGTSGVVCPHDALKEGSVFTPASSRRQPCCQGPALESTAAVNFGFYFRFVENGKCVIL